MSRGEIAYWCGTLVLAGMTNEGIASSQRCDCDSCKGATRALRIHRKQIWQYLRTHGFKTFKQLEGTYTQLKRDENRSVQA
jgi:hypothetical protein